MRRIQDRATSSVERAAPAGASAQRDTPSERVSSERGHLGRFDPAVAVEDPVGLRRSPRLAEVGVDRAGLVERRLHDAPRPLDDVLAGEASRRAVDGVVEQPLVGLVALAERGRRSRR